MNLKIRGSARPGVPPSQLANKANKVRASISKAKNVSVTACKDTSSRNAKTVSAIVEANRKTELCKNWPNCKYGSRCAFAHSTQELRRLSLAEMEHQGRIPCASKFRVFPCATFLATGACPYRDRCVFIHDPRVKGEHEAYLYATPGSNTNKEKAGKGPLFWPDAVVPTGEASYTALYSAAINYEVCPRNPAKPTYFEDSVSTMWKGFVKTMPNLASLGDEENRELYSWRMINGNTKNRRLPVFAGLDGAHESMTVEQELEIFSLYPTKERSDSVCTSGRSTPTTTPSTAPSTPCSTPRSDDTNESLSERFAQFMPQITHVEDLNNLDMAAKAWGEVSAPPGLPPPGLLPPGLLPPVSTSPSPAAIKSVATSLYNIHNNLDDAKKPAVPRVVSSRCRILPCPSPFYFPDLLRGAMLTAETGKLCSLH